jgi:hypothetical protein
MDWGTRIALITATGSLACGSSPPQVAMRAPNPNGCHVMLFEQPGFTSFSDVLNGPGRWPSLETIRETNYPSWTNRIRSLRVGGSATLTAFAEPQFRGQKERYRGGSEYEVLPPALSGTIQSLELTCDLAR